jgi:DNA-binding CsgD family transcriptional regulator
MVGDTAQALKDARESLRLKRAVDDTASVTSTLERVAWIAAAAGEHRFAARLLGAADRQWRLQGKLLYGVAGFVRQHDECQLATRHALGDAAFAHEFGRGAQLSLADAIAHALGEDQAGPRGDDSAGLRPASDGADSATGELGALTHRQREVAALVAEGHTNKQIAERLMISQRTAESHVEQILVKLGLTSRTQIAAWVARSGHPLRPGD